MICPKCGYKLPDNSLFCNYCGTKQETVSEATQSYYSELEKDLLGAPSKSFFTIVALLLLMFVLFGGYYGSFVAAQNAADSSAFAKAKKYNILPSVAENIDSNLNDYIEAGLLLEGGFYKEANEAFSILPNDYKSSEDLMIYASYLCAVEEIKAGKATGITRLNSLARTYRYEPAIHISEELKNTIYYLGIDFYNENSYGQAETFFSAISPYFKSETYLLACKAHQRSYSITESEYYGLLENLDFGGIKDAISSSNYLLTKFLMGEWKTTDGEHYFKMYSNDKKVSIQYNLPVPTIPSSYAYSIHSGNLSYHYKGVLPAGTRPESSKEIDAFRFSIMDDNAISIYCYKNNESYLMVKT